MQEVTQQTLEKSPSPIRWGLSAVVWFALAFLVHNAFLLMLGITIGFYFGNYLGRIYVLRAWNSDLKSQSYDIDQMNRQLEDIISTERERVQRQEVCSDKSHWSNV